MKKLITFLATLLCAGALTAGTVTLTWNPNAPGELVSSYRVYSSIGTNAFMLIGQVPTNTFTITNVTWQPGLILRFYVTACNQHFESDPSAIAAIVKPSASMNLSITSITP